MNDLAEQIKAAEAREAKTYQSWLKVSAAIYKAQTEWLAARRELGEFRKQKEIADAIEASKDSSHE